MANETKCALVGIDVETSGARTVAVSAAEPLAEAEERIRRDYRAAGGIHEQDSGRQAPLQLVGGRLALSSRANSFTSMCYYRVQGT